MAENELKKLLNEFKAGKRSLPEMMEALKDLRIEPLSFANIDHHRAERQGFPEVIFCRQKTPETILEIARRIYQRHDLLLATHASEDIFEVLRKEMPFLLFHREARCIHSPQPASDPLMDGRCCIITAGTSDIPIAREAELTLEMFGFRPSVVIDVGAAGIHRLDKYWDKIEKANVLIVVAGMEGALPTIVAGLIDKPVIAVPTSVGYGVNFQGVTTLLAMLNSCANSVSVVNIDNGFGAAFSAALMLRQLKREMSNYKPGS